MQLDSLNENPGPALPHQSPWRNRDSGLLNSNAPHCNWGGTNVIPVITHRKAHGPNVQFCRAFAATFMASLGLRAVWASGFHNLPVGLPAVPFLLSPIWLNRAACWTDLLTRESHL